MSSSKKKKKIKGSSADAQVVDGESHADTHGTKGKFSGKRRANNTERAHAGIENVNKDADFVQSTPVKHQGEQRAGLVTTDEKIKQYSESELGTQFKLFLRQECEVYRPLHLGIMQHLEYK